MLDRVDREQLIFQITLNTKFTNRALQNMTDEQIVDLYKTKVLRED